MVVSLNSRLERNKEEEEDTTVGIRGLGFGFRGTGFGVEGLRLRV